MRHKYPELFELIPVVLIEVNVEQELGLLKFLFPPLLFYYRERNPDLTKEEFIPGQCLGSVGFPGAVQHFLRKLLCLIEATSGVVVAKEQSEAEPPDLT